MVLAALVNEDVRSRYQAKVKLVAGYTCWFWTGAISGRGHGRLWVGEDDRGRDVVVIAHRYGYGLAHGASALQSTEVVAHTCDNPLCQNPDHWQPSTHAQNRQQWAWRRHQLGGALRDVRGARGRALLVRDAVRGGFPLGPVLGDGVREVDQGQLPLWS